MRRHGFDPISLIFGAIFTAVGLIFLFGDVDLSRVPTAWAWPIPLMAIGALIILLAVGRGRGEPSRAAITSNATTDPGAEVEPQEGTGPSGEPEPPTETVQLPDGT